MSQKRRRAGWDHPNATWRQEERRLDKEWDEKLKEAPPSRSEAVQEDVRRGKPTSISTDEY